MRRVPRPVAATVPARFKARAGRTLRDVEPRARASPFSAIREASPVRSSVEHVLQSRLRQQPCDLSRPTRLVSLRVSLSTSLQSRSMHSTTSDGFFLISISRASSSLLLSDDPVSRVAWVLVVDCLMTARTDT